MKEPTLGNPQNTIAVLQKYNFIFQKKFGQNFLIDTHVLDKIIRAAEIGKDDLVLEIGPGIGTMTQYLSCAAGKVIAVEIDRALIPILEDTLDGYDNVRVINEDVLKVDIAHGKPPFHPQAGSKNKCLLLFLRYLKENAERNAARIERRKNNI